MKPLIEDDSKTIRTWLMKIDAGAFSELHAHHEYEQIYVLSGSFYDQDSEYGAGDFIVRAPDAMHTAGSKTGASTLLTCPNHPMQENKKVKPSLPFCSLPCAWPPAPER